MKIYAALALLSLTLAACSQQAVISPDATTAKASTRGEGVVSYRTTAEAQEAHVLTELTRIGMGAQLSAQAIAGQVYLNVLPVPSTAGAVRAYVKSTFTSPAICSVTWGDGSTATAVASPTVGRIETKDHLYATFGTYTVTVTCMDGATILGQQSMTIQGGVPANDVTLDFETPAVSGQALYNAYEQNGFIATAGSSVVLLLGANSQYNPTPTQVISPGNASDPLIVTASNGLPFTLKSFGFAPYVNTNGSSFAVTGLKQDGTVLSTTISNNSSSLLTQNFSNWTNLTSFRIDNASGYYLNVDNIKLSR
ncbi:hypothetical protein E7T06_07715 [Deinococcus sp. Arct2-2]|uniref:hypothetical protein n=1 Tax=Deinococcus sp. Arct2-2 TaxID=2568653 RepID=UPI0010A46596|nr:hypothetical protein [Deinococcus sp. Arct2-2]THF70350.1 hypothetical protein E7T06_07715 [Deinococcus sp. Arct2-2]